MILILKRAAVFLPYLFVFFASLYLPTDPDLGWHLKYGEYFFQHHQLLRNNTFSTMMPDYHWVNGTWGTDIITYILYKTGGFFVLSLAAAGIVTLTFFFVTIANPKGNFLSEILLFALFIFLLSPVNANAFRGQQLSYLFLAILLFLLSNYKPFTKKFFLIPLLFLFWCNIHEEAFLFLTLFGAWVVIVLTKNTLASKKYIKNLQKKENIFLLGILLLSSLVTFINPFGPALQGNALSYLGNNLVTYISEYEPYTMFSVNWWGQIFVVSIVIVYLISELRKKNFDNRFLIAALTLLFLLLGFSMRRYIWPAYYMTLTFIFIPLFTKKSHEKYAMILGTILTFAAIIITLQYKLPLTQFTTMSWDTYCSLQAVPCSPQSAQFLKSHHITGKLFSYYDWGGWLIWNYPTIRPSIDGRMTEWRDTTGYSAVADYGVYINAKKSIEDSPYDVVYLPNDTSPLALALSQLVQQNKWKVIYEDERAGIVVRVGEKSPHSHYKSI